MSEFGKKVYKFFRRRAIQAVLVGLLSGLIGKYGLPFIGYEPPPEKQVREDLIPLPENWQQALTGTWVGTEIQEEGLGDSPVEFTAKLTLVAKKKHINGIYTAISNDPNYNLKASFNVTGVFHGQFLKLEYENRDISVQGFGTILLLWTPTGELKGRIVGFSAVYKAIAPGIVQLRKET